MPSRVSGVAVVGSYPTLRAEESGLQVVDVSRQHLPRSTGASVPR